MDVTIFQSQDRQNWMNGKIAEAAGAAAGLYVPMEIQIVQ
jgi:hypothetical protein